MSGIHIIIVIGIIARRRLKSNLEHLFPYEKEEETRSSESNLQPKTPELRSI